MCNSVPTVMPCLPVLLMTWGPPQIMTWGQYAEAAVNIVGKRFGAEWPEYIPDYTKCADHFAIHAGGAVLVWQQQPTINWDLP
jgi:hypothetical protein